MKELISIALIVCFIWVQAEDNRDKFTYQIKPSKSKSIIIDGILDDSEWGEIKSFSQFINKWPIDSGLAISQTEVRMTYDENFIYVAAVNYQPKKDVIVQTLKRDNPRGYWGSDGFTIVLDPLNQQSNGFLFGVNAGGAQMEASLNIRGTRTNFDENWDNKWFSKTKIHDDRWIAEIAIPYNTLRFQEENLVWGVNFVRNDMKNNVYSTWAQVPIAFAGIDLGHMGSMVWDKPIKPNRGNIAIIPYASGSAQADYEEGTDDITGDIGFDAKIGVSSSLNLDLTVNPDFSNVDVDRQVTNLTQFNIFFPERRGFFLENSDLFSNFGSWGITPFFSRKIGLDDGKPVPILFGARLSGNLSEKIRIGVMDVQTNSTDDQSATNFFVTSVHHQILSRSRIKALFTNKQTFESTEIQDVDKFNRTGGLEFDYISKDGKLNGTVKYHSSFNEDNPEDHDYYTVGANYNDGKFYGAFFYNNVGKNYQPEMGFVPRLNHYDPINDTTIRIGFQRYNMWAGYLHRPKRGKINVIEFNPWSVQSYDKNGDPIELRYGFWYTMDFKSRQSFEFNFIKNDMHLRVPLDLIDGDEPLPIDAYQNHLYRVRWNSDNRKAVSGSFSIGAGDFYTGSRTELTSMLNLREQPWGNFSINYTQNRVDLGGAYGKTILHLFGPSAEISFSNNMFWTTFLQYNTQAENFNVNSRFQWRYRPMSDFFVVYSENYTSTNLEVKNRGIVFKLTYWLNI